MTERYKNQLKIDALNSKMTNLLVWRYGIETVRKQDIHVVTKDTLDHIFIYPQSVILDHVQIWKIE